MAAYAFTARDSRGQVQRGIEQADTAGAAVSALRDRGWAIIDVKAQFDEPSSIVQALAALRPNRWLPPLSLDVEISLNQMAVMLRGGLTLLAAMRNTAEQSRRKSLEDIWNAVAGRVQSGSSLAEAMSHHRCFPVLVIQLIRIGEQTGTLELVMRRAANVLERRRSLRNSMLTAMAYPSIVVVAAIAVTAFMVLNVIPKLQGFLEGLGRKLPAMTENLLYISTLVQTYGTRALTFAIFAVGSSIALYFWPPARFAVDKLSLRIPIVGGLLRIGATALVARAMAMLLQSGVTLLEALRTMESLHHNVYVRRRISLARDTVMEGGSLAEGLRDPGAFLPMLPAMVAVGESAGTLDEVLEEIARFHEEQLQNAIRRFGILVEPAIIVVVGCIVGYVYIAFFVAMFAAAGSG